MLISRIRTFVNALRRRSRVESEMDAELAFHRDEYEAELLRSGTDPKDARRRARIAFGTVDAVKEDCRQALGLRLIDELRQDIRYALRSLANHPGITVVAALSLALGIGANTAMFSLIDQLLLRKLPVSNPQELVYLYSEGPWSGRMTSDESGGPSFSYPMLREMAQEQTPFVGLGGAFGSTVSLAHGDQAEHGKARLVSGNYFDLLGVRPALGRLLTEDDDRTPGAHPIAVLSYSYWSSRLGGDPAVLNQTILVNNFPFTIVGVAPQGFRSERPMDPPAIYVPLSMASEITQSWNDLDDRQSAWVTLFGRLKPGVSLQRAGVEINVPYRAQLEKVVPLIEQRDDDFLERFRARTVTLRPGQYGRGGVREDMSLPLLLLSLITMLVLLIACANVANLQLARGAARMREVSIRLATGASRWRLIRQFLAESWCVAIAGGAVGIGVAYFSLVGVLSVLPAEAPPDLVSASLNGRVLLFSVGLSLVTGIVFGLLPAIRASRADLASSMKDQAGQITLTGSSNRLRKTLVAGQVAVSLLLLIPAGLLMRTLGNLSHVDLGIQVDRLAVFSITPTLNGYTDVQTAQLHDRLIDQLVAIPGVRQVSSASVPAIADSTWQTSIELEGFRPPDGESSFNVRWSAVGPDYFQTMGTPVVTGRSFTLVDGPSAPGVVVVNQAFVREYLGGENPLGRHITMNKRQLEIVGVVGDAHYAAVREEPPPLFYTALRQSESWGSIYFYLRTAIPPEGTMPLIRREVASVERALPIRDMKTMETVVDENLFAERTLSALTAVFAGLALLLAVIGLYGVLAYNIARRTREIGIRMALGANSNQVHSLVIREVAFLLVGGTVVGLAAAAAASRVLDSMLYGLERWDAATYVLAAGLLWLVSLGAAYIPAHRAARIEPTEALRYE